ncbi:hypothetical protein [Colwellia sp. RSH04]|uniref:hypothetical protein n=1 Tax=Colwellia sp. RSH04 TaxID=2305464 RepID=UPI000E578D33|nr:hypothetical protein [Colwellia sp. RSH04]RHW74959.1 hypothetical protein D1094_16165 [Colwellia sp. RSH04]
MLLPSSSFFLSNHLTVLIEQQNHNEQQLQYALTRNNSAAFRHVVLNSRKGSEPWFVAQKALAKIDANAALSLAKWYQKQSLLLTNLSLENYTLTKHKMEMWLEQAVRLKNIEASAILAQHYLENELLDKAKIVIQAIPKQSMQGVLLKIKLAIATGDQSQLQILMKKHEANLKQTVEGQSLLNDIYKFNVLALPLESNQTDNYQSCVSSLQLFASQLSHLYKLEELVTSFREKKLSQHICIAPIRYISNQMLDCKTEHNLAIACDETGFSHVASTVDTRHIGIMLGEGGANVHFGILYFDKNDSVDVFSHEITHLMGFIDEYPLNEQHDACSGIQTETFAHNISVLSPTYQGERKEVRAQILKQISWSKAIEKTTPILQPLAGAKKHWRLGTPKEYQHKVGLFPANSCESTLLQSQNLIQAFKPLYQRTHLEYFEYEIPTVYLSLLAQQPKSYLMPSFHWNIALAQYLAGNTKEAKHWLSISQSWHFKLADN